jgi:3-hydroxyisobutyrate dehydrogenase-like beta-hydroxyacid dehydrogenase
MDKRREHLSFVGLGQMGRPMALNLLQAVISETELCVYDQQTERLAPLLAQGARSVEHLGSVVTPGGIVFTMVPDDRALLQITLGEGGILKQLGSGGIHVSLSTVSPQVSTQLARLSHKQGGTYLAATVLGHPDAAARGDVSIYLAGDAAAKTRVRPLLATMGKRLYDLGEVVEQATVTQLACRFLLASVIEAMGEAAALVEVYGLDRERFLHMLVEAPLFSGVVFEDYGPLIGTRDFSDRRVSVKEGLKDIELAIQMGQQKEVDLPYADVVYEHLLAAQEAGRGHEDWSVFSEFARPGAHGGLFDEEPE